MAAESQYFTIKWTATAALRKATPEITRHNILKKSSVDMS